MSPLDGGTPERHGPAAYDIDDLLLVVAPEGVSAPVHAAWNPVVLTSPPYRIDAELPTLPGFDPGRALARPSGPFVLVGRVRVGLVDDPDGGHQEHAFAWINRYTVEQVEADIELFFFFPGAEEKRRLSDEPTRTSGSPEAATLDPAVTVDEPAAAVDPAASVANPSVPRAETGSATA
jgi:hypothetical protein